MRINLFKFAIVIIIVSCSNKTERDTSEDVSIFRTTDREIVDSFYTIPLDSFCQFQTFDESKMDGIGKVEQRPFVYVRKMDKYTIVRRSDKMDSLIIYQRAGKYWTNYHWENFDRVDSFVCKCGSDRYAVKYSRLLFNDKVLELRQTYYNGETVDDLIINDHKKVIVLRLMDDIKDVDNPFEEMIKIADFYSVNKSLELYNKKYMGIKRFSREYTIYEDNECLRFYSWEKRNERKIILKVTPLHYFDVYPDF